MWQEAYLESLTPLSEALDEVGLSTELLGVSFAPNDSEKWDQSFAASIVGSVPTMVEILEDTGFFLLLAKFSSLLKGLKTTGLLLLLPPEEWKNLSNEGALKILAPISRLLVNLSPWKIYQGFCALRDFLEEIEDDWEGPICVEYLAVIQQGLEELELWNTLACFQALHDFLTFQQRNLVWLAFHPEAHKKLGPLKFFPILAEAKETMDIWMEFYNDCLVDLQGVLNKLNEVEAIVPSPDDLDVA